MFQDIFTWAGQLRSVQMSKGATVFAFPEHIESKRLTAYQPAYWSPERKKPRC